MTELANLLEDPSPGDQYPARVPDPSSLRQLSDARRTRLPGWAHKNALTNLVRSTLAYAQSYRTIPDVLGRTMKAVTIHNTKTGDCWTEIVHAEGPKWIDSARPALDLSVARRRLGNANQKDLQLSVRFATQSEVAARLEELKLARALRFSGY